MNTVSITTYQIKYQMRAIWTKCLNSKMRMSFIWKRNIELNSVQIVRIVSTNK